MSACRYEDVLIDPELSQEIPVSSENTTFVSSEQATEVAEAFFSRQSGNDIVAKSSTAVSKSNVRVETVKDGNNPLLYILNYPERGFVIVSATRNYYPVLAYSDKNTFAVTPDMGNVWGWLEESKQAIKTSNVLNDSVKATIRSMWRSYEIADHHIPAGSVTLKNYDPDAADAFSARMTELHELYGNEGWFFYSMTGASSYFSSEQWDAMCEAADSDGCDYQYCIVGIRSNNYSTTTGPLLTTIWDQEDPYNTLIPQGRASGCAAVAMAQIMNYHEYPASIPYNGISLDWNNMPDSSINNNILGSHVPHLLAYAGEISSTNYWSAGSWALPGNVVDGLRNIGYNLSRGNSNFSTVQSQIYQQNPVLMLGFPVNVTQGHYWVCDGVQEASYSQEYFIEYQIGMYGSYTYSSLSSTPYYSNPGTINSYAFTSFYMNWGWGGSCNGFFYNVNSGNGNFQYFRENFYISHP